MTSVAVIRNTINAVIMSHDPEDVKGMTDSLVLIWIAESWSHKVGDVLSLSDLTDAEFRMLAEWASMSAHQYSGAIAHIKDMREIFPGLGLHAANYFVRSFYARRNS